MIRVLLVVTIVLYPSILAAETISSVRHSQNLNGFRVVIDWSDRVPNYDLETEAGEAVLWLKTVTRISAQFPKFIEGWSGEAGYQSGLYRITFPKIDGIVSVFAIDRTDQQDPRLVIDVVRDQKLTEPNQVSSKRSNQVLEASRPGDESISAQSIRSMEKFLARIEARVASGEISPEYGYQLAQRYRQELIEALHRQINPTLQVDRSSRRGQRRTESQ